MQVFDDLLSGPIGGNCYGCGVDEFFLRRRKMGCYVEEVYEFGYELVGVGKKGGNVFSEGLFAGGCFEVYLIVLTECIELTRADAVGQLVGEDVFFGHFCEEFLEGVIGDSESAAMFVVEEDFGFCEFVSILTFIAAELEVFLVVVAATEEVGDGEGG